MPGWCDLTQLVNQDRDVACKEACAYACFAKSCCLRLSCSSVSALQVAICIWLTAVTMYALAVHFERTHNQGISQVCLLTFSLCNVCIGSRPGMCNLHSL
jgi:hypothetical protein